MRARVRVRARVRARSTSRAPLSPHVPPLPPTFSPLPGEPPYYTTGCTYRPPAQCTYRRRRAACLQGPTTRCAYGVRSSLGRAGRTAYRGYHPRLTPQRPPHTPRHTVINIPGYHPIGTLVITPGTARPSCAFSSSTVSSQADTCAPGPTHYCTYGLRVPASRAVYVPEAQGGLPAGLHVRILYVRTGHAYQTRARYVRTVARQACSSAG